MLEQQEMRRQQKELAEKERIRQETERRRGKEEEEALEKARKGAAEHLLSQSPLTSNVPSLGLPIPPHTPPTRVEEVKMSNDSMSLSPGPPSFTDNAAAERERQRKREQERRRREAVCLAVITTDLTVSFYMFSHSVCFKFSDGWADRHEQAK